MEISKDILYNLYVEKHMRMVDIAKELDTYVEDVRNNLIKHNISIRKRGYGFFVAPEIQYSEKQLEFFDGLIISDGSIVRRKNNEKHKNDFISCAFKHEEFADYISKILNFGRVKKKVHISDRYKSGQCEQYYFLSTNNTFFTKQRNRWYPNGKKIIPNDFRLSPISLNIMYLSDGWLAKGAVNARYITICTQSFNRENIESVLASKFKAVDIRCKILNDNQIRFDSENTVKFLKYIGPCPVECYKYKWNIAPLVDKIFVHKPERENLFDLYETKKLSTVSIARIFNTNYNTVNKWLRDFDIKVRSRKEASRRI